MEQKKLCRECAACWCYANKRCDGRYHNVEEITTENGEVFESSKMSLADLDSGFPGDKECERQLVTVEDGCICLNYAYQYPVRPLATFTKSEMAEFMTHLMEKTWYTMFLQRVFVRRVFVLKGWVKNITLDVSKM
ncbi:MAG: hypothetical protein Q4A15_10930 [Prevotellaceae bacterium]|nr:hypothetical protein [Prevotellaceae bacterium]